MRPTRANSSRRNTTRPGFSLVESAFCTILVGGLVVAALDTMRSSVAMQQSSSDNAKWKLLAAQLLNEILVHPYEDPDEAALLGLELEEALATRPDFDDVDDYDGLWESPLTREDGTALAGFDGWARAVVVKYADPVALMSNKLTDSGVKRVKVTVHRNGVAMGTMHAIRTGTPSGGLIIIID